VLKLFFVAARSSSYTGGLRVNGLAFDDRLTWVSGRSTSPRMPSRRLDRLYRDNSRRRHGHQALRPRFSACRLTRSRTSGTVSGGARYSATKLTYHFDPREPVWIINAALHGQGESDDGLASTSYQNHRRDDARTFTAATGSRHAVSPRFVKPPAALAPFRRGAHGFTSLGLKNEWFDHRVRFNVDIFIVTTASASSPEDRATSASASRSPHVGAPTNSCNVYSDQSSVPGTKIPKKKLRRSGDCRTAWVRADGQADQQPAGQLQRRLQQLSSRA